MTYFRMKKLIFEPSTVFVAGILLETFLHFYFPVFRIIPSELRYLGWVLIILCMPLSFWQFITMKGRTPIPYGSNPKALITNGPFKYTRNAFYLSLMLISLGVAVYLTDLSPFIIVVAEFYIFDKYLIPQGEKILEKNFGQSYKNYKQKVRRWV